MARPHCPLCQPRVICTADPPLSFDELFLLSVVSHDVFLTGLILPESFSALQVCSTVIFNCSTHYFLLDDVGSDAQTSVVNAITTPSRTALMYS